MNGFFEKMEEIINSKEFYEDLKDYFEKSYSESDYYDADVTESNAIRYLYNKYFKKFEDEYYDLRYNLNYAKYDFQSLIIARYESMVYEISHKFLIDYSVDYYNFDNDEDYEEICNSCGRRICEYMAIKSKPTLEDYEAIILNFCEKCAIELRDFIDNEAFW